MSKMKDELPKKFPSNSDLELQKQKKKKTIFFVGSLCFVFGIA